MNKHTLQIMSIRDLIRFHAYIKKNHIRGKVIQNDFCCKASSLCSLALALPLESATLILDDNCNQTTDAHIKEYQYV